MRPWLVLAALQLGCVPPPTQRDVIIHVDQEGFAARMRMLCRLGVTDDVGEEVCEAQKPIAQPIKRRRPSHPAHLAEQTKK